MKNTHYKSLFKTTGMFGAVEVLRLFLRMVTNIGASHLLGPKGVGLIGFVENTVQLLGSLTSFGVQFTGVRDIAALRDRKGEEFQKTLKNIHLFCLVTGIFAGVISLVGAKYLSILTFDSQDYILWFVALSIYFVFNGATQSKIIFLEGTQNFLRLLRINLIVSFFNMIVVLLAYYFFHINGIIISMIINSLSSYLLYYSLSGIPKVKVQVSKEEIQDSFKKRLQSGSLLSLNVVIGFLCFFVIRKYFYDDVGLNLGYYQAGNIMLVSYLGIIFIAMNKFFFPRLTRIIEDGGDYNLLINNQLEICLLLIIPAILIVYSFGTFLLSILFSPEFVPVFYILIFGLAAIVFKGFNYAVGYLFLSNKNYKQYFIVNAFSDIINIFLTIFLFQKMGLYGIGLALLINYFLCAIYTYAYVKKKYFFKLSSDNIKLISIAAITLTFVISAYYYLPNKYFVFVSVLFTIISLIYSGFKLDEYILNQKVYKRLKSFFK